ncbi:LCP family protein [Intestinimonas aquisgranensis]|nr:LCP family protein [Intestinimonas aquisgranensis]
MNPEKENKKGGRHLLKKGEQSQKLPKQPKKPLTPKQKALRAVYLIVTILAALVVVVFAVSRFLFVKPEIPVKTDPEPTESSAPVESTEPPEITGDEAPDLAAAGRKEDYYTFLLVGRDTGGGGNTDTIMVVSYDVKNQELNAMSIPRDTIVNKSWDIKKINSVYNYAGGGDKGMAALMDTVSDTIGFAPDFHIVVEWEAVGKLATAIGGVDFDVPVDMNYDDPTQDLHIHISKGFQHLDGEQVMQVLRFRKNNNGAPGIYAQGDIGRIQVQQDLLMAIADKLLQPSVVAHIPDLVDIFMENVETDLTIPNLLWLAKSAIQGGLRTDSVNFVTMPANYNGYFWSYSIGRNESYVFPYADEIVELVNEDFNPYLTDVTKANLDIVYKKSDGSIAATGGSLKDSKANAAYYDSLKPAETETPDETETPAETETPTESPLPSQSGTPTESVPPTETQSPTETPAVSEPPAGTGMPEDTTPPAETQAPASTAPAETEVSSQAPAETSSGEAQSPGDIGIPIFTPPEVPAA